MRRREEERCDHWFDKHEQNLIPSPDKEGELPPHKFLWENYWAALDKTKELNKTNPGLHCYTLIEENGKGYIIDGWHYVNRFGYFISTVPVEPIKTAIRYW